MHSLIYCIGNAINFGCAFKHLIKFLKPWPIKRGCTSHLSFLLFNFMLLLHLIPLVTHLLPTLMHSWKMCIQSLCKIFPICFPKRLSVVFLKFLFIDIQKKVKLCILPQLAYILLKSWMFWNNINWCGGGSTSLIVHEQIKK